MFSRLLSAALVVFLSSQAAAQTSTSCNPLNSTCKDDPALGTTYNQVFNTSDASFGDDYWNITAGKQLIKYANEGAQMTLASKGQSITAETMFYIFFGSVEIDFQAAPGRGIISTFNLLSDDLDEIDVEIQGNNETHVSTNWYGQGDQTQRNAVWYPVAKPAGASHKYRVEWGKDATKWFFDDQLVRTVAAAGPKMYPQTPSYLKLGVWAAGDSPSPGVVEWAGGATEWNKGPFTMTVKSVKIVDAALNKTSYSYPHPSDGSWQSIKVNEGKSTAATQIEKPPPKSLSDKVSELSTGAKIGIVAAVCGTFLLALVIFFICCCRQRRQGAKERAAADAEYQREQTELQQYRQPYTNDKWAASVSTTSLGQHPPASSHSFTGGSGGWGQERPYRGVYAPGRPQGQGW